MRRVAEEVGDHTAFRRGAGRETPVVADDVEGRRVDPAARKLRDHRGDLLQKSRLPRVVGVQQGDVVARRLLDTCVGVDHNAAVAGQPNATNALVVGACRKVGNRIPFR